MEKDNGKRVGQANRIKKTRYWLAIQELCYPKQIDRRDANAQKIRNFKLVIMNEKPSDYSFYETPGIPPSPEAVSSPTPSYRVHEITIKSAIDLMDALTGPTSMLSAGTIFRGQAESSWGISPSVFRNDVPMLLSPDQFPREKWTYGAQVKLEIELLWLFVARANEAGLPIPGDSDLVRSLLDEIRNDKWWVASRLNLRRWPHKELIPALALAQHHGVPTRLLDWTYGALPAIYFAAEGAARNKQKQGKLAIWTCKLHDSRRFVRYAPSVEIERPSNASNANLRAQRGCLMVWRKGADAFSRFNESRLDILLSQEADRSGVNGPATFMKFTLPQSESGALLQLLSAYQIDGSTMFPGFDGVAKVVRERQYWDGFVGTGSLDFEIEISKRREKIKKRLKIPVSPIFEDPFKVDSYSEFGGLEESVRATRLMIEAGDYIQNLEDRLANYTEILKSEELRKSPRMILIIEQLITDLKKFL